jgi:hypothetical protein
MDELWDFVAWIWRTLTKQGPAGGCVVCGFLFWSKRTLNKHLRVEHGV